MRVKHLWRFWAALSALWAVGLFTAAATQADWSEDQAWFCYGLMCAGPPLLGFTFLSVVTPPLEARRQSPDIR